MEKIVRLDDVYNLFTGIIITYETEGFEYENISTGNNANTENMIEKYILKRFEELDNDQKIWLKDSMAYFILYEPDKLSRMNDSGYIPFDFSVDAIFFFNSIWNHLFPNAKCEYSGVPHKIIY